jgi:hypothetical protein
MSLSTGVGGSAGRRLISPKVERIDGRLWLADSDFGESICNGGSSPLEGINKLGGDCVSGFELAWFGGSSRARIERLGRCSSLRDNLLVEASISSFENLGIIFD